VLVDVIRPLVERAMESRAADGWFFIRYADPEPHVRVRFHGDPARLASRVLPALAAGLEPFVADGRVSRWQLDTYVREVERYGGDDGMLVAERLFQVDSDCALDVLHSLPGDEGLTWRWKLALYGVDLLLDALALALDAKQRWARERRDAFAAEFRADGAVKQQLGGKYRLERGALAELRELARGPAAEDYPALRALARRTRELAPIVAELRALEREDRLNAPIVELAASYAHMHVNRCLRSAHRMQELVIYELLDRMYRADIARAGKR
jgi:class I lanthipeptide synthase